MSKLNVPDELLSKFVDSEVGLDVGVFRQSEDFIWYGWKKKIKGSGDKEEWKEGALRLIEILKENGCGEYELFNSSDRGASILRH